MKGKLLSALKKPLAILSGALGTLAVLDPSLVFALLTTVWVNAGTLFTGVSIFAFTVVPNVSELQHWQGAFVGAAVVLAIIRGSKLLLRVYNDYTEEIDD